MKVVSARSAFLSDWEVLDFMREMDPKAQKAAGIDSAADGTVEQTGEGSGQGAAYDEDADEKAMQSLPSNLRTIQYAVLESLTNIHRPCMHQTAESIPRFLDALHAWERGQHIPVLNDDDRPVRGPIDKDRRLTKGERLMIVNMAPDRSDVLSCMVEELFDRFSEDETNDLVWLISSYLFVDYEAIDTFDQQFYGTGEALAHGVGGQDEMLEDAESSMPVEGAFAGEEVGAMAGYDDQEEDQEMLDDEAQNGERAVDDEAPDDD